MIFYVFITKFFYIFIKLFLKLNNIISSAVMHVRILNEFSDSSTWLIDWLTCAFDNLSLPWRVSLRRRCRCHCLNSLLPYLILDPNINYRVSFAKCLYPGFSPVEFRMRSPYVERNYSKFIRQKTSIVIYPNIGWLLFTFSGGSRGGARGPVLPLNSEDRPKGSKKCFLETAPTPLI